MKKSILGLISTLVLFGLTVGGASANEGIVRLAGKDSGSGRCFAVSIYIDGSYKVLVTCRGLQMALDPVLNKYVVWANAGERQLRLGEIVSGKLQGNLQDRFDSVFVSLEADGYPSKPMGDVVLTGKMEAIDFGKGVFDSNLQPSVATTPTAAQSGGQAKIDERGAVVPTVTSQSSGRLTAMAVGIGKAILFGFILLLIVVGVMSFLARRKNL